MSTTTTQSSEKLIVANIIAQQIGGQALYMFGAKDLVGDKNSLAFRVRGSKTVNHVTVRLNFGTDSYIVTFRKIRGLDIKVVEEIEPVFVDTLREVIARGTGLAASL